MPAPQPGTPTAVVLTGVTSGARFGIEWHSVLASTRAVKPRTVICRALRLAVTRSGG